LRKNIIRISLHLNYTKKTGIEKEKKLPDINILLPFKLHENFTISNEATILNIRTLAL
jgi:hypothetical protein